VTPPDLGQLVIMDDHDAGTSYEGTVIGVYGPTVEVEWHEQLDGEDSSSRVAISSLRGYDEDRQ
jgi:hypothetical protein